MVAFANPTQFREAFFAAADARKNAQGFSTLTARRVEKARAADPTKHRRLWTAMENFAAHRFERQTGKKYNVTTLGDGTFLKWLTDNLPAILKLVMAILAAFGV